MKNLFSKEKKLESVLQRLSDISRSPNVDTSSIENLTLEKNQLQSEKNEIDSKYKELLVEYNNLKERLKKLETEHLRKKQLQEQFNQDIDELGEETESLVEEIEKWQM